jgi:hypothetical protein
MTLTRMLLATGLMLLTVGNESFQGIQIKWECFQPFESDCLLHSETCFC